MRMEKKLNIFDLATFRVLFDDAFRGVPCERSTRCEVRWRDLGAARPVF